MRVAYLVMLLNVLIMLLIIPSDTDKLFIEIPLKKNRRSLELFRTLLNNHRDVALYSQLLHAILVKLRHNAIVPIVNGGLSQEEMEVFKAIIKEIDELQSFQQTLVQKP